MSRNLCTSSCCENIVRLSDIRGKPIEFRAFGDSPPQIGTRWDCPSCGTAYFVIWHEAQWNHQRNEWASGFVLDLSYYESFNDEHYWDENKMGEMVGISVVYEERVTAAGQSYQVRANWREIWGAWNKKFSDKEPPIAGLDEPAYVATGDCENKQWVW